MAFIVEGEKVNMMTEMVPLINVQTGEIVDWRVLRSFRLNTPKKAEKKEEAQKPLQTKFDEEEKL